MASQSGQSGTKGPGFGGGPRPTLTAEGLVHQVPDIDPQETQDWLESNASEAAAEDFDEQFQKLSDVAYPITSKLYGSGGPGGDDEMPDDHDEL